MSCDWVHRVLADMRGFSGFRITERKNTVSITMFLGWGTQKFVLEKKEWTKCRKLFYKRLSEKILKQIEEEGVA